MKIIKFFSLVALVVMTVSCTNRNYVIEGQIEMPDLSDLPDSLRLDMEQQMPSLDGKYVYLMDLDGEPYDSAMVQNGTFRFEGKVEDEPYFSYFACEMSLGILAIEPGTISLVVGETSTATGTPLNDTMSDIDAAVENLRNDLMAKADAMAADSEEPLSDEALMPLVEEFSTKTYPALLDSFYQNNLDNLAGIYAVNVRTAFASSAAELRQLLDGYPAEIRDHDLFSKRLAYMEQYEAYLNSLQNAMPEYQNAMPEAE